MMMWVYLAALGTAVLLVIGGAVWWWGLRDRSNVDATEMPRELTRSKESVAPESFAAAPDADSVEDSASVGSRETPVPSKKSDRDTVSMSQLVQLQRASQTRNPDHVRLCPECDRSFPANYVVCPFDSTALQTMDGQHDGGQSGAETESGSGYQRCPTCDRRYYPGQSFCYRDGTELVAESDDRAPATGESAWRVCPDCGWEDQTDERLCPNDGSELIRVGIPRSGHGRTTPPVPVMKCPECGESAPPGVARCPNDDTLLTPIQNETLTQFPRAGLGPRRKVCPECGDTYSRAGRYCSRDGTELVERN